MVSGDWACGMMTDDSGLGGFAEGRNSKDLIRVE